MLSTLSVLSRVMTMTMMMEEGADFGAREVALNSAANDLVRRLPPLSVLGGFRSGIKGSNIP